MVTTLRAPGKCAFFITLLAVLFAIACGGGKPVHVDLGLPAPNPNGCYAFVYQRPDWQGDRAVLNGPGRWRNLERVQVDRVDWRDRIQSLDVGPAATVTVYTKPNMTGTSRMFAPGTRPARLDVTLTEGIESLEMTCAPAN